MKKFIFPFSLAVLLLITAASCTDPEPDSITSKTYDISNFTSLDLEIIGEVQYEQADSFYLNASGSTTVIDALTVSDSDGKLSIELKNKKKFSESKKELVIKVGSPQLKEINFESIGNLHLKNKIQTSELTITNNGIGKIEIDDCHVGSFNLTSKSVGLIEAKGSTNELNINSQGVGNIDCSELKSKNAKVVSKGTGNISVFASESVDISLQGVGNVNYYGNPSTVNTDISGIGKATPKN